MIEFRNKFYLKKYGSLRYYNHHQVKAIFLFGKFRLCYILKHLKACLRFLFATVVIISYKIFFPIFNVKKDNFAYICIICRNMFFYDTITYIMAAGTTSVSALQDFTDVSKSFNNSQ